MRFGSLKARLTAGVVAAVAVIWLATAAFTWLEARHEIDELLDGHLAQAASLLVVQVGEDLDEIDTEHAPTLHRQARKVAFQIRDADGVLRVHSVNAPNTPLGDGSEGFSEREVDGQRWRVFTTRAGEGDALIHVAERVEARREVATELAGGLLLPLAGALPLLALALWLAIGRGLRELEHVAGEVGRRAPDNLTPLASEAMPGEVRPLAERLNDLFGRLGRSLANERRFTADAAHELRTPLAAIRAQAQVALGAAADDERRHALAAVVAGCDRATRLVEQLLTLARLDTVPAASRSDCELRRLAAETLAELAPRAAAKAVELALADGPEVHVAGHEGLLRVLLRNLADNALRYGPPGSTVEIAVGTESGTAVGADAGSGAGSGVAGGQALLAVVDNGPGIPAEERGKVLERFYRVLGSGEEGSGLGLSIVRRIVELHGGRLELADGPQGRGLVVRVRLPVAG